MKTLDFYKEKGINCEKEAFEFFINSLKQTINSYSYFVDVDKVISYCTQKREIILELEKALKLEDSNESLNRFKIVGLKFKKDFIETLLSLIAVRKSNIKKKKTGYLQVCERDLKGSYLSFTNYYLEWPSDEKKTNEFLNKWYFFLEKTKLIHTIRENKISLVDYMFGLEVGMNTNARKNRSGSRMEEVILFYLKKLCSKDIILFKQQKYMNFVPNCEEVFLERKCDFILKTPKNIWIIETNFFSSNTGSKINKTIPDFINIFNSFKKINNTTKFLWILDGFGWRSVKETLFPAFKEIDYILNIHMLEKGYLNRIIK